MAIDHDQLYLTPDKRIPSTWEHYSGKQSWHLSDLFPKCYALSISIRRKLLLIEIVDKTQIITYWRIVDKKINSNNYIPS